MKSFANFLFITLLVCASSKHFNFDKQGALHPGKIPHEVSELFKRRSELNRLNVEANIYATNPVIKEAVIIPSKLVDENVPIQQLIPSKPQQAIE